MPESRPSFPPFNLNIALTKVQAAEDAWNTRDPHRVSLAYTPDSVWRNRDTCIWRAATPSSSCPPPSGSANKTTYCERACGDSAATASRSSSYEIAATPDNGQHYGNELWEFDEARPDAAPRSEHQRHRHQLKADRRWFGPRPEHERGMQFWTREDIPLQ